MHNPSTIRLGISACLLGQPVRYDGNHKLDRYLRDTLGRYVQWVAVCPEFQCGLGVPREAMRLVEGEAGTRLMTNKTALDKTENVLTWATEQIPILGKQELCGFVFKSKSPSSGLRDAKVYDSKGRVIRKGAGLFAAEFVRANSCMPVEDEGRLHDEEIRENFLERVFVYARWREWFRNGVTISGLVEWQRDHKLLLMAHSPSAVHSLGKLVAEHQHGDDPIELARKYFALMMKTLELKATVKKNVNVLYHIAGYFKRKVSPSEKEELIAVVENYHKELVPLIVPVTLLNHYVRLFDEAYLKNQVYLNPHPLELKLRNHV